MAQFQFIDPRRPQDQGPSSFEQIFSSLGGGLSALYDTYEQEQRDMQQLQQQQQQYENEVLSTMKLTGASREQAEALASVPSEVKKELMLKIFEQGGFGQEMTDQRAPMAPEIPQPKIKEKVTQEVTESFDPQAPVSQIATSIGKEIPFHVKKVLQEDPSVRRPQNVSQLISQGLSKEEAKEAVKESAEYYKKLNKESSAAKTDDQRLKRMEQLVNSGKLRGAGWESLLENAKATGSALGAGIGALLGGGTTLGLGTGLGAAAGGAIGGGAGAVAQALVDAFASPETQEFKKLQLDFMKNIKDSLGVSRITNMEVENFLKTVPSLLQTDEGKKRVIRNLRLINEGKRVKEKIAKQIIKSNNGRRPYNLEALVEKASGPLLDKLSDAFIAGTKMIKEEQAPVKIIGSGFNAPQNQGPFQQVAAPNIPPANLGALSGLINL